ncbi:hypothetical protein RBSWK_06398 [Rhodopirellula baltica SWK14]|uniref:Uncharacterized protein n=1 Tax=Rhodopirellula baltica SWK14 TaxID=993516 RepID=L7C7P0_RHOBT|nr:hypothetical protein RBSWK_06398 [Rhodopirellula baltica SWK14]
MKTSDVIVDFLMPANENGWKVTEPTMSSFNNPPPRTLADCPV